LEVHLSALKHQGIINQWHDRRIIPGEEWEDKIDEHLNSAQIILLLISSDFVASEYCYNIELKKAMERHSDGEARVIPIILRPAWWNNTPFSRLQALPKGGKAVTLWDNMDYAFLDITNGIWSVAKELMKLETTESTIKYKKSQSAKRESKNENIEDIEWLLVLTATISDFDKPLAEAVVSKLRKLSKDNDLILQKIVPGSVRLHLKGSKEGFEQIKFLYESGTLNEIFGMKIKSVSTGRVHVKSDKPKIKISIEEEFGLKHEYDHSNFISYLNDFPAQIANSIALLRDSSIKIEKSKIQNVIFTGIGDSAHVANLFLSYIQDEIKIPSQICQNLYIPNYVNNYSLFIVISYSGNSIEVLNLLEEGIKKSAKVVGISSGGELEKICISNNYPHIKIPKGLPARQALGYLFFPLLLLFEEWRFISSRTKEISEAKNLLYELVERYNPEMTIGNNLANHIAQSLYHAIPVIYTGVPFLFPVPTRWRSQFNENSKAIAINNIIPEVSYNEIIGWEGLIEINKHLRIIVLRDIEENKIVKKDIATIKNILREKRVMFGEVFSEGSSRLARLFSLISLGDWASYYLAMLNEKDPLSNDSIIRLKEKLTEFKSI